MSCTVRRYILQRRNRMKHKPHRRAVVMLLAVLLMISLLLQPIQAAATRPEIQIGDYIRLGTYEGAPIVWRCVAKDNNGPLMLSDRVLEDSMPYDAATGANAQDRLSSAQQLAEQARLQPLAGQQYALLARIPMPRLERSIGSAAIRRTRIMSCRAQRHTTRKRVSSAASARTRLERSRR